ncbi:MAG: 50S ribosomal protein L23 [Puniceicoccales bacterium]|jgi:large subunit ribosomal protein L23|nr:50S ribosomal protein L23 [Puniceicoccales bacterium]
MESDILKKICYTEKFTALAAERNQYVFDVAVESTKYTIADAVRRAFSVHVEAVNIIRRDGKARRDRTKRGHLGYTAKRKIAIVTLRHGDKIEIV